MVRVEMPSPVRWARFPCESRQAPTILLGVVIGLPATVAVRTQRGHLQAVREGWVPASAKTQFEPADAIGSFVQ